MPIVLKWKFNFISTTFSKSKINVETFWKPIWESNYKEIRTKLLFLYIKSIHQCSTFLHLIELKIHFFASKYWVLPSVSNAGQAVFTYLSSQKTFLPFTLWFALNFLFVICHPTFIYGRKIFNSTFKFFKYEICRLYDPLYALFIWAWWSMTILLCHGMNMCFILIMNWSWIFSD